MLNVLKKLINKIEKYCAVWLVIAILLFANAFCQFRIVFTCDLTSSQLKVQSDGSWFNNSKGEFYNVFNVAEMPDELKIEFSTVRKGTSISIGEIDFYYGSMLLKKVTADKLSELDSNYEGVVFSGANIDLQDGAAIHINLTTLRNISYLIRKLSVAVAVFIFACVRRYIKKLIIYISERACVKLDEISMRSERNVFVAKRVAWTLGIEVGISLVLLLVNHIFEILTVAEMLFVCMGTISLGVMLAFLTKNKSKIVGCSIANIIPLYFSIERLTSYLLVDEPRAIAEQVDIMTDALRHWYFGYSRMNYAIMGTLLKNIPEKLLEVLQITSSQYAKLLHWYIAILMIGVICILIVNKCIKREGKDNAIYFTSCLGILLSVAVVLNALKFYNYDTFAVLLGVLGTLYLYLALKQKSYKTALISLIILSMALQEKNIALPYFGVSMLVCAYYGSKSEVFKKYRVLKASLLAVGLPTAIFGLTALYVSVIVRESAFSYISIGDVVLPLTATFSKVLTLLPMINANFAYFNEATIVLVFIGVCIFTGIVLKVCDNAKVKVVSSTFSKYNNLITMVIVFGVWIIGAVCIYLFPIMYLDLVWPNEEGYYISQSQLTAISVYFPAANALQDILIFIGALYGLSVAGLPTVILIIAIVVLVLYKYDEDKEWNALFLFTTAFIPIIYGVLHLVPWQRYMNIYIAIALAFIGIKMFRLVRIFVTGLKKKILVFSLVYVLAALETYTFAPVYYAFWPVWNVMPYVHEYLEAGETMTVWQGGVGEDLSLAGNLILDYCEEKNIPTSEIKIYSNYHGLWNSDIVIQRMPGWRKTLTADWGQVDISRFDFRENAFYIFSRWGLSTELLPYEFPRDVEPALRIEYRGATEAWIFTGNQLEDYMREWAETNAE